MSMQSVSSHVQSVGRTSKKLRRSRINTENVVTGYGHTPAEPLFHHIELSQVHGISDLETVYLGVWIKDKFGIWQHQEFSENRILKL